MESWISCDKGNFFVITFFYIFEFISDTKKPLKIEPYVDLSLSLSLSLSMDLSLVYASLMYPRTF